ncbi:LEAF RUST 10 DISEASE-RESISTANCE LOCUS RECEPTOR-LIKE PROTEIN KINASE-like 2.4 isoform X10 [Trifolium pratense]|uniref:LEAF RUST 10 DISEASE-RESISTANCE LOCUS RECEPTOR-LIKE PROTEIN KINASE-like 2.4 isoform X10 n=1 Tax=Trifolium pratense TaxID=57577 RepID=UPI001E6973A4|nr:LEAF RUST 10 DISEASE-RESISTANCE LOCUS RECEPTOR-LIKE PROTEIN KINASE-like 2.4 isoform X10 [Trifolium pratense]
MDNHFHVFPNIKYIFFFSIITTFFPQQSKSVYNYASCRDNSYSCGNITNISYPFWGQNGDPNCGAGKPFYLNCNENNVTTIMLSLQNFTVLDINTTTHTIKLQKPDLFQDLCSPQFDETFLSPILFHYLPNIKNITIYYDCSSQYPPNFYPCGPENPAFFYVGEENDVLRSCKRHIQVPVGTDFPIENNRDGYFEGDVVEKGLNEGFEVEYIVEDEECLKCLGSDEGDCKWKNNNDIEKHVKSSCYYDNCPNGSIAHSSHCHKNSQGKMKIILGVGSAAMVALLMCIMIYYFRGKLSIQQVKFRFKAKNDNNIEAFLKDHGAVLQKTYKFSEIKKMTNSFKIKLGQGGFGVVYKGKLVNGSLVAVKILNSSKENGEEFINEVASITRTSHVNIVTLLGFCYEGRKKALIYEFMSNGSLDKFIYNKGHETITSLSWDNLYQIAKGIACGLEYLHRGCTTRILHFDIKPHNILLDENFCPKISDFGLAKLNLKKESIISMSGQRGTMGYVAPEMWSRQFGGVSHKSDVYSYGVMLLEMVGGRKNINADASRTSEIYFPHWVYSRLELGSDLRPDEIMDTEEDDIIRRMTIVGLWCIQTFPNDRPTMSKVIKMLEGSMKSLEIPPKPLLSSPTSSESESRTS